MKKRFRIPDNLPAGTADLVKMVSRATLETGHASGTKSASFTEYTIPVILANLGLTVSELTGRILDMGCGKGAHFVEFLRGQGLDAEGIDTALERQEHYLINASAEAIPRPDNYFDLVVSHYAPFRNGMGAHRRIIVDMAGEKAFEQVYARDRPIMLKIIDEGIRVLKPGCRFIIWPWPSFFMYDIEPSLTKRGLTVIEEQLAVNPMAYEKSPLEILKTEYTHRVVLIKP